MAAKADTPLQSRCHFHCFTRGKKPDEQPDPALLYSDLGRCGLSPQSFLIFDCQSRALGRQVRCGSKINLDAVMIPGTK